MTRMFEGEYIGLQMANGEMVYEGDIFFFEDQYLIVAFSKGSFGFIDTNDDTFEPLWVWQEPYIEDDVIMMSRVGNFATATFDYKTKR
jgi:hypothetical protein